MARILVIGTNGNIGQALIGFLPTKSHEVFGTTRKQNNHIHFDLSQPADKWPELPEVDVAVICAAITKLDACENDPETTSYINVAQTKQLIQRLSDKGVYSIFLSTNQVFDGLTPHRKTSDATSPTNEYGKQKAELEQWITSSSMNAATLRLTKVITGPLPIFAKWDASIASGDAIEAFTDLSFAPLPIESVCEGIHHLASEQTKGIYHLSGKENIAYFDIAKHYCEQKGASPDLVKPRLGVESGIPKNFLPTYGTLDMEDFPIHVPDCLPSLFQQAQHAA